MSANENVMVNDRLFYLSDDIDNISVGKMCFNLLYIIEEDDKNESEKVGYERKPIKIYVNSYGGSVHDMWALIDIMLQSKTPIHTYCTGYAMSAAFNIYLAGSKRFASKHATLMYHQINCIRQGKYQDLVEDRAEMDYMTKAIEDYVAERTKLDMTVLEDVRERKQDVYFHIEDAVRHGIVDEVI